MLFILDTNAISDASQEHPRFMAHADKLGHDNEISVCTITAGEALFGIERLPLGKRRQRLSGKVDSVLSRLTCYPVPPEAAGQYARIKQAYRAKGLPLDENDLWIAATAIALDAALVTRDTDFLRVEGLHTEDWSV